MVIALFTIDREQCTKCGACVDECPIKIIYQRSPGGFPAKVSQLVELCLYCGHCVSVCPSSAFYLESMSPGDLEPVSDDLTINPKQAWQFLCSRRSGRAYKKKKLERQTLQALVEVGCGVASAKNQQPWRWIVVEDTDVLRSYAAMVIDWMELMLKRFPDNSEVQAMKRPVAGWKYGMDVISRGAPHLIMAHADRQWPWAVQDCTIALVHIDLYAYSLGLGACRTGYITEAANRHSPLNEALGIPKDNIVAGSMVVGYPKHRFYRIPQRNAPRVKWIGDGA